MYIHMYCIVVPMYVDGSCICMFVWEFLFLCGDSKGLPKQPIRNQSAINQSLISFSATLLPFSDCFSSAANYRNILFSPIALKLSHNSPNLAFKTFNFGQFGAGKTFCLTGTHTQALFV